MTVLVTGGTGLLGANLVRQLLERGFPVRVLVRNLTASRKYFEGLEVELFEGEIQDREAVLSATEGVECVYHSAAMVHIGRRGIDRFTRVNVEGTRNVIGAVRACGAKLLFVSSADAVGLR
ncbi:MAG: NAD-dependent epimerase/dehydratase family protein, partial [Verrucomicrobiota bacterium]